MSRTQYDNHHRIPRSRAGTNERANLSLVPILKHRAFHILFKNWLPEQIADELNRKWIDPKKKFIVVPADEDDWKGDGLA